MSLQVAFHASVVCWEPRALQMQPDAVACARELQLRSVGHAAPGFFDAEVVATSLDDIAGPCCLTKWRLVLGGGHLVQLSYLKSRGKEGARLMYNPAVSTACLLWTSAAWVQKHPTLWDLLDRAIQRPGGKWRWFVGGPVDFVTRSLAPPRNSAKLVGVVTSAEKNGFPANFQNVYTGDELIAFVCSINVDGSHSGVCPSVGQ
jgi:hypothetical protein